MNLPNEPQVPASKEQKEILSRLFPEEEKYQVVERPTTPEIPPEIEKVEVVAGAEITLPKPITDDSGAVVLDAAAPQQVTITLPITDEEIQNAFSLKIIYSIRWLAEWAKRVLRLASKKFIYKLS